MSIYISGSVIYSGRTLQGPAFIPAAPSQLLYTTAGSFSWVVPAGVISISAVAVGPSGGSRTRLLSNQYTFTAGGGGALAYVNDIPVTPGETLTIYLGASTAEAATVTNSTYIERSGTKLVHAGGGRSFPSNAADV